MLNYTQQLLATMAQLRHPQTGCAWDLKQNFKSLIPYLIEEAYEVIDAIERDDIENLRLELGDLLLQVVFHAQLANEQGLFDFEQIAQGINDKLIRRHPHVFAGVVFTDDKQRQLAWEQIKAQEKNETDNTQLHKSVLAGIALNLPALMLSEKVQNKASDYGFDWRDVEPVFAKVLEELTEVKEAWQSGNQADIEEEIGDLLFVAVNLARHLKVNPELALKSSTEKFSRRFYYIEQQVALSHRALTDCELEELDALWHEAKRVLKGEQ